MVLSISEIITLVITVVSAIDFIVFVTLFLAFICVVPYKAKKLKTKIVSVIIIVFFIVFKTLHIPMFLSTIPIIHLEIPYAYMVLEILTWSNIVLAIVPLLLAILTATYEKPEKEKLKELSKKKVNIIMPIYNEKPSALFNAIESVRHLEYPKHLIHLYLAFDDNLQPEAFMYMIEIFGLKDIIDIEKDLIVNIDVDGLMISICRFKHGGKKSAQYGAFKLMESYYTPDVLKKSLLFFIDSDIILKPDSLAHFTYHMKTYNKTCLTGLISCIASGKPNFLTFYQDIEYISGQIFWRNAESYMGSSSCLPGAFVIMKYSTLKKVSDKYFKSHEYKDDFDYQRFYLGEDRYLTHLLMEEEYKKIGFCESARCKTEAPDNLAGLLKQRRRWFLGHISNDTWMISSLKLWQMYPVMCLFNFLNNARNTSIYIYLLYFVLLFNQNVSFTSYFLFILLPLVLNWVFIAAYAMKLRRRMNIFFYFMIVLIQPIFSMMYMYYTIYNIRTRSWGGVRVEPQRKRDSDEPLNTNESIV
jgi:chitin synthase